VLLHRYEELEKLYYKKKFIEYGVLSVFIVVLFIIFYILYSSFKKNETDVEIVKREQKELKKKLSNNEINRVVELKKELKSDVEVKVKKLVLYPIYPDINSILNSKKDKEENKKLSQNTDKLKEENIVTEKIDVTKENQENSKEEKKKDKIVVKPVNRIKSRFLIKTKEENLTTLIEAYKHSPNYEKGIKVVELYFKEKKYKESLDWSKKVNKLNPEDYKSWYFFAKNLIELGDKEKAKKVLIIYLDNYGKNEKIEKLLRSIK
jgi:tetratricopeptide (TPR) repeat protein